MEKNKGFFENLRNEVKSIGVDTRASDMRRFKARIIDKISAMETGTHIREELLQNNDKRIKELQSELELYKQFAKEAKRLINSYDCTLEHKYAIACELFELSDLWKKTEGE